MKTTVALVPWVLVAFDDGSIVLVTRVGSGRTKSWRMRSAGNKMWSDLSIVCRGASFGHAGLTQRFWRTKLGGEGWQGWSTGWTHRGCHPLRNIAELPHKMFDTFLFSCYRFWYHIKWQINFTRSLDDVFFPIFLFLFCKLRCSVSK